MSVDRRRSPSTRDVTTKVFHGTVKKTAAIPPNTLRFCITSDIVDRDGDLVIPSGGQWVEYMANPVVLWAHQFYQLPVAKCVGIGRDDHAVYADFQFAVEEHEFAAEVHRLYDGGYLNAVSIGFQVLEAGPPDYQTIKARPDPERRCRRVIRRWNLLEVSCVPIGSNPEALQGRRRGPRHVQIAPGLARGRDWSPGPPRRRPQEPGLGDRPDRPPYSPRVGESGQRHWRGAATDQG